MKIICSNRSKKYKDGDSKTWKILNSSECGFTQLLLDESIKSKKAGVNGLYYKVNENTKEFCDKESIEFVDQYLYKQ